MPYCPDNYDQFKKKDKLDSDWLRSLPVCEYCGHEIQDEKLLDLDGSLYHVDCALAEFQKDTEDYRV